MGEDAAVKLIRETLDEEKETDKKLTKLSERINVEAAESVGEPRKKALPKALTATVSGTLQ